MSAKSKRTAETTATVADPLAGTHSYHDFPGHAAFISDAMARSGRPLRILPRVTASVPIGHLGRILSGLVEMSRRNRSRPLWPTEIDLVKTTLLGVEEVRWHYRVAATASFEMAEDARRAFGLHAADDGEGMPEDRPAVLWRFVGIDPLLRAESERLGLPESFVKRARQSPECHRIATRIGDLHRRYLTAPKNVAGRPVLSVGELAAVRADLGNATEEAAILSVLAEASQAMLAGAYRGFGLELPARPPADMPDCPGCAPHLAVQKRTSKATPFFA